MEVFESTKPVFKPDSSPVIPVLSVRHNFLTMYIIVRLSIDNAYWEANFSTEMYASLSLSDLEYSLNKIFHQQVMTYFGLQEFFYRVIKYASATQNKAANGNLTDDKFINYIASSTYSYPEYYDLKHSIQPDEYFNKYSSEPVNTLSTGSYPASHNEASALSKSLPGMKEMVNCPDKDCPWKPMNLRNMIMHVNDTHEWTREAIADWLETLDIDIRFKTPEEPAKQLTLGD